jgi:hypothetical protein
MPIRRVSEWRIAEAIAAIPYCNPFLPERLELERRILGNDYVETGPVIRARPGAAIGEIFPHVWQFHEQGSRQTAGGRLARCQSAARSSLSRQAATHEVRHGSF